MAWHSFRSPLWRLATACGWALLLAADGGWASDRVYSYPQSESSADARTSYPVALLNLCSAQSGQQLLFRPSPVPAQQNRNLRRVAQGDLDIIWSVTDDGREQTLRPVRIPIDRGLIGWRMLLVQKSKLELFNKVTGLADLLNLRAGQGHDWPDVDVLRANGLTVETSSTYEGLFHMLARGHIHYFPRSVAEIEPELKRHANLQLAAEPNLVLHYPEALYFFVARGNEVLAGALERCLHRATADGSLKALFYHHFGEVLANSQLRHRRVLTLNNPLLPPQTPVHLREYWFSPDEAPL